jgi:hypothetical protein
MLTSLAEIGRLKKGNCFGTHTWLFPVPSFTDVAFIQKLFMPLSDRLVEGSSLNFLLNSC